VTTLDRAEGGSADRPVDRGDALAFIASALARPRNGPVAIVIPAPSGNPLALIERLRRGNAVHVHDERRSLTALGATRLARLAGERRFSDAKAAYERARNEIFVHAHDRVPNAGPIWTMGFAFGAGQARDAWAPLGDGLLMLPRWAYRRDGGTASLALVVDRDEPQSTSCALAELDALWDALAGRDAGSRSVDTAFARHVDEEMWVRSLADVQAKIADGAAAKIVVARRTSVAATGDIDPVRVLRRLERPGATMFCVRRGSATFVGATPERLFRKRARHVATEAIAGTAALERDPAGRRLLGSEKDRHEHRLVVEGICHALSGLRAEVSVGPRSLRTVGALAHLATPIDAHLATDVSAFDILRALHPTPAVGGVPRDVALRWIAEHEPDRGWYAGPFGWIDADGNADVHVALRSALIVGANAYAYAGCGVVDGSDPRAEYVETALKLAPMLAALGAEP
jgi:isochorismate synthase